MNPIIPMPGRGSDGREFRGYARLYILRGRGPRNPSMAFDARARDDEPDEPVSNIGGNQAAAIASWARDNLAPEQLSELIDALMALQSQLDEAGPDDFPGKPEVGGEEVSLSGLDGFAQRYPEAARIGGSGFGHDGRSPLHIRRQAVAAAGEAQVRAAREFAKRWPEAARIKL